MKHSILKNKLAESLIEVLGPIREEIENLLNNKDELNKILAIGTEKAEEIANPILQEVYKIVGFR